jgi:hypothetical protein
MTPEQARAVRELSERTLTPEEADAYLTAPMSDEERQQILDLVRWFTRRYPTGLERLAHARRAYRRWQSTVRR